MTISEEAVKAAMDAFHEAWNNNQGLDNELPVYAHRAALSAALPFLPVLEPSAARELALEEAARWHESEAEGYEAEIGGTDVTGLLLAKEHRISAIAIRALSSPDHADAGKVEGDGWLPIESAPTNRAIQIFIPNADYYGNDGVYAGILVDLGTGQRWATFGWAVARDLPPHMHPSHWRPLPSAPASEGAE